MAVINIFVATVTANVVAYCICKWLDRWLM